MEYNARNDEIHDNILGRRLFFGVLIIVCLIGVVSGGGYVWNQLPTKISKQTEYAGLRLGMTMNDVIFVKGIPNNTYNEGKSEGEMEVFSWDKKIEDYNEWSYEGDKRRTDIVFDKEKNILIAIRCFSADKPARCPAISGITDGDSEKKLYRKFGPPDTSSQIYEGAKTVQYKKIGVVFYLTKQTVYMMGINDTRYENKLATFNSHL
jgi:hypothetical protein